MWFLIFLLVSYVLLSLSLVRLFDKAGEKGWKALVPGLNFIKWCEIIGRPKWYAALLLVPLVNIFIFCGMSVDMVRSFGKLKFIDSAMAVIYAPLKFFFVGRNEEDVFGGGTVPKEQQYITEMKAAHSSKNKRAFEKLAKSNPYKKNVFREWTEAIIFAVFAAAFIRMFLIEAYTIPTPSMEGSLLVGDYLFVSKAHYGIRTPKTIAMIPLLHNRIPGLNRESYLSKPKLPMYRLPAIEKISHNEPVVFNWPVGDSVYVTSTRSWTVNQAKRMSSKQIDRLPELKRMVAKKEFVVRPIDKKDHYIKRCVGLPGDDLAVVDRQIFINGKMADNPKDIQFYSFVSTPAQFNFKKISEFGIDLEADISEKGNGYFTGYLTPSEAEQLQAIQGVEVLEIQDYIGQPVPNIVQIAGNLGLKSGQLKRLNTGESYLRLTKSQADTLLARKFPIRPAQGGSVFPHDPAVNKGWTVDNYGPIHIPKKGETIELTKNNMATYHRAISVYEGNKVKVVGEKIYINGTEQSSYTFDQDYYWMMGDNRHNSEDSRIWGFVPFDHVVGKPLFIWMSAKEGNPFKGIRWNRLFTSATKN